MNILQINSSARVDGSQSTQLANALVQRIRADNPEATVTLRDLSRLPHPQARRVRVAGAVYAGR